MGEGASTARPSYLRLLRDRSFASLWTAQVISQSGDAVFDVALLWLVLVTTGSAALVGLTQAAVLLPMVLAGPVAGVYADRFNRRNLMIVSNVAQGLITAALSILYATNTLHFAVLIFLVLLLFTGAQFFRAANGAIIPRIVRREDLAAANGLFTLSASANQLASYSIGGIALAVLGAEASITYDSLTFFAAAALLMLVAPAFGQPRGGAAAAAAPTARGNFRREFREGLRYVRGSRLILQLMVFGLVVNFFAAAMAALLAPYARDWVHGDATTYGFILAAYALGTIAGSIIIGKTNYRGYVGKLVFGGVFAAGGLIAVAGFASTVPVALVLFVSIGVLLAVVNQPIQVLVQARVPPELLGRTITVMVSVLTAAQPLGALLAGMLAALSTIGIVFVAMGVAMAAATALLYLPFKELAQAKY